MIGIETLSAKIEKDAQDLSAFCNRAQESLRRAAAETREGLSQEGENLSHSLLSLAASFGTMFRTLAKFSQGACLDELGKDMDQALELFGEHKEAFAKTKTAEGLERLSEIMESLYRNDPVDIEAFLDSHPTFRSVAQYLYTTPLTGSMSEKELKNQYTLARGKAVSAARRQVDGAEGIIAEIERKIAQGFETSATDEKELLQIIEFDKLKKSGWESKDLVKLLRFMGDFQQERNPELAAKLRKAESLIKEGRKKEKSDLIKRAFEAYEDIKRYAYKVGEGNSQEAKDALLKKLTEGFIHFSEEDAGSLVGALFVAMSYDSDPTDMGATHAPNPKTEQALGTALGAAKATRDALQSSEQGHKFLMTLRRAWADNFEEEPVDLDALDPRELTQSKRDPSFVAVEGTFTSTFHAKDYKKMLEEFRILGMALSNPEDPMVRHQAKMKLSDTGGMG